MRTRTAATNNLSAQFPNGFPGPGTCGPTMILPGTGTRPGT